MHSSLRQEATAKPPDAPPTGGRSSERATIGRSITIKGEVKGDEDLLIQGTVDGSVALVELGAGESLDTTNIRDPIVGFVFGNKGLMFNLTLEGSKFTRLDKSKGDDGEGDGDAAGDQ